MVPGGAEACELHGGEEELCPLGIGLLGVTVMWRRLQSSQFTSRPSAIDPHTTVVVLTSLGQGYVHVLGDWGSYCYFCFYSF